MPISLHIDADSASDLVEQVKQLAGALSGNFTTPAETNSPKPSTRKSAKTAEPATDTAAGQSATSGAEDPKSASGSTQEGAASGASGATDTAPTAEVVRELAGKYAAKAGPAALGEIFIENGSPQGKFSQLPVENYGAVYVRLTELLA